MMGFIVMETKFIFLNGEYFFMAKKIVRHWALGIVIFAAGSAASAQGATTAIKSESSVTLKFGTITDLLPNDGITAQITPVLPTGPSGLSVPIATRTYAEGDFQAETAPRPTRITIEQPNPLNPADFSISTPEYSLAGHASMTAGTNTGGAVLSSSSSLIATTGYRVNAQSGLFAGVALESARSLLDVSYGFLMTPFSQITVTVDGSASAITNALPDEQLIT